MAVKSFNPKQVIVIINGVPISEFADGTFVSVERMEDAYSTFSGADGAVARVKSNNPVGNLVLTLMQTSSSNQVLSALALADQRSDNGYFPVLIKDNLGQTLISSSVAWISRMPTVEFSKDISNREWNITLADLTYNVGGNTSLT